MTQYEIENWIKPVRRLAVIVIVCIVAWGALMLGVHSVLKGRTQHDVSVPDAR